MRDDLFKVAIANESYFQMNSKKVFAQCAMHTIIWKI